MRVLAWTMWDARRRPTDILALFAAAAYFALVAHSITTFTTGMEARLLPLPVLLTGCLIIRREPLSPVKAYLLGSAVVLFAAQYSATRIPNDTLFALAVPAVVVSALFCLRWPALALAVVVFCTGAFGSLDALAGVPAAKVADLMLVGLWAAGALKWIRTPPRDVPVRPAILVLGAYLVLTLFEVLLADSTQAAIQSFRNQNWYLATVILLTYAPWTAEARRRMLRGVILVGLAVGGYATLRWQIGPAAAERSLASFHPNNFLDGELRPVGSFSTAKELSAWTAIFAPFLLAMLLTLRGRWQLVALLATALTAVGMLAADVRAGPAAAVPGALVVVALYQMATAFRGRRGPAVLVIMLAACVGAAAAFSITLGDKPDTAERYSNILHPGRDASYQARLVKWRTALDDIEDAPLGYGIGSAGRGQKRFGKTQNISSDSIDNSYLKVAFEQGFVIMIVLAGGLVLILLTLLRGGATLSDAARAGPAIGASGTLVAMALLFWVGNYIEGLPALGGWLLVGLGLGQVSAAGSAADAT
jgi:hypothetical protein